MICFVYKHWWLWRILSTRPPRLSTCLIRRYSHSQFFYSAWKILWPHNINQGKRQLILQKHWWFFNSINPKKLLISLQKPMCNILCKQTRYPYTTTTKALQQPCSYFKTDWVTQPLFQLRKFCSCESIWTNYSSFIPDTSNHLF